MGNRNIRVLVAEDHHLIRQGLVSLLETDNEIVVVGEAQDGKDLIRKYKEFTPDVVLSDIEMPERSGIDALTELIEYDKFVKVVYLSMHFNDFYIYKINVVGGKGYLNKKVSKQELIKAIKNVYEGGIYFQGVSEAELAIIMRKYIDSNIVTSEAQIDRLTTKEKEILRLIGSAMSSDEIAIEIKSSKRTVDTHRARISAKLNITNLPALVKFAVENMNLLRI